MLKKDHYTKYVYSWDNCVWRLKNNFNRSLENDFPLVYQCLVCNTVSTMTFYRYGNLSKCWRDKHGNIVVRIFHDDIKQTKIDF